MKSTGVAVAFVLALCAGTGAQMLVDTIGFTTRDRQMYGPAIKYVVNDTLSGVHAVWKDGLGVIRYNFRPRAGAWRWPGGTTVNSDPRNLGGLDVDVSNGRAVIVADYLFRNAHVLTRITDSAAGAAVFREQPVSPDYRYTLVGTANYGYTKFAALQNDTLYYRSFLAGYPIGYIGAFPSYNLAVSKQTGRYGLIWTANDGPDRGVLFLKQTPNNGQNWYATSRLSDSIPSGLTSTLLSGCATYDTIRIHLAAETYDGENRRHSQLWHYCPYLPTYWQLIHDFSCDDTTRLGDDALAAGRPSIGMNRASGEVCVAWEQFDPKNVEPQTGLCRADIWTARSTDQGQTWGNAVRLTSPDSTSKRFPFLAEVLDDTLHVICFADLVAGFSEQGQGPQTRNPVLYLRVPVGELPSAVAETPAHPLSGPVRVIPSISSSWFTITAPAGASVRGLAVYDRTGVLRSSWAFRGGALTCGGDWNPGVYFLRVDTGDGPTTIRVIKTP